MHLARHPGLVRVGRDQFARRRKALHRPCCWHVDFWFIVCSGRVDRIVVLGARPLQFANQARWKAPAGDGLDKLDVNRVEILPLAIRPINPALVFALTVVHLGKVCLQSSKRPVLRFLSPFWFWQVDVFVFALQHTLKRALARRRRRPLQPVY